MKNIFFLSLVVFLFSSCIIELPDTTGRLIIQNNSGSSVTFITDVWTRQEGSLEWVSRWHGIKANDEEITLYLEPDNYNLRIRVEYLIVGQNFETGYKQPAVIKAGKSRFYVFDGMGIYDMEAAK
jgi:hypothetical protein